MSSEAIQWNIHSDAHFKLAFKLYYPEWNNRQTEANSIKKDRHRESQHTSGQRTNRPACSIRSLDACGHLFLKRGLNEDNNINNTHQKQQTHHAACLLLFWLFFPSIWGRGELEGGGGRKRGKGGVRREKNITHGLGRVCMGGFIQDSSPVYASEHEREGGGNVCWQASRPTSWLAVPLVPSAMTRWQQALSIARALSCHRNLPLDTVCWLAVSNCCCSVVRLMKPRGWGRASGAAYSRFPALVESVARHIRGQLVNKHQYIINPTLLSPKGP